jgi:glycolate oxidase FAD binding subunit
MDLTRAQAEITEAVRATSGPLVASGAGTHAQVGNPVAPDCAPLRVPAGILVHEPADMTVRVLGGTPVAELAVALAEHGQEVVVDPRDQHATIGGCLAAGLSGPRRLRYGPLRDVLLEAFVVDGAGRPLRCGGPTVKNVSGYDLPRLLVGSLGTLAVIVAATLRCRPRPARAEWFTTTAEQVDALYRASSVRTDGTTVRVLLEGSEAEIAEQAATLRLEPDRKSVV